MHQELPPLPIIALDKGRGSFVFPWHLQTSLLLDSIVMPDKTLKFPLYPYPGKKTLTSLLRPLQNRSVTEIERERERGKSKPKNSTKSK